MVYIKGATASVQLYSLVETAKANGPEPYVYLRYILERLPHAKGVKDYDALLPWNCMPALPRQTEHPSINRWGSWIAYQISPRTAWLKAQ